MREELDKIYEIATRVLAEPPDGDTAPLVEICTLIEEAAQGKPAPWTPRERRLRAALEKVIQGYRNLLEFRRFRWNEDEYRYGALTKHEIEVVIDDMLSALADTTPPDPRDEALDKADQCLSNIKADLIRSINQTTLCHHRPRNDREREAAALCCGEGYGNMMAILSTQWHLSVGGGAFVVGECVTTAQNQVKDIEAALAAIAAAKGEK